MLHPVRRFPPAWSVDVTPGGFEVVHANHMALAHVKARDDLARRSDGSAWLTHDEARRIGVRTDVGVNAGQCPLTSQ